MARTVCLSRSINLDHKKISKLYEQIAKENFGAGFILDTMDDIMLRILKQNRCSHALYAPHNAAYKSKKLAYEDRARRMVKFAQEAICIYDSKDRSAGPILVAIEFNSLHPDRPLTIYMVNDDVWKKVGINEVDNVWQKLASR